MNKKLFTYLASFYQALHIHYYCYEFKMTLSNDASNARNKTCYDSMKTFLHITKSLLYSLCKCKTTGENFQAFLTCETFENFNHISTYGFHILLRNIYYKKNFKY